MFVDPELLNSGANEARRASAHAQEGADDLARGLLLSGMFGDFAAAGAFHDAVRFTHTQHVKGLHAHQETLTVVGAKAEHAAAEFMAMDENNAAKLRAAQCNSNT
jgi:Protein of unknown function (DUF2563)